MAITGAAGFIGRAVTARIARGALGGNVRLRLNDLSPADQQSGVFVPGSFADSRVRQQLLEGGVDVLFHLASLPGGASERDPVLGKQVNLDGSIALINDLAAAAGSQAAPVLVYASSIAALGRSDRPVDEHTALRPAGSYGTHKAMLEFYIADLTRRGVIDGRSVRPAGIVARPRAAFAGFATAWMSELFHAALEDVAIAVPARPGAQVWLQSVDAVAENIVHAATIPVTGLPASRVWTLPASVVRIDTLVAALERYTGRPLRITYGEGPTDQPALDASAALALGFDSDGDADALVRRVAARIAAG